MDGQKVRPDKRASVELNAACAHPGPGCDTSPRPKQETEAQPRQSKKIS